MCRNNSQQVCSNIDNNTRRCCPRQLHRTSWDGTARDGTPFQGDFREARRLYRTCVELDPRDGRGWLGLARQMQKIHK